MSSYKFSEIEKKWQERWSNQQTYKVIEDKDRPKYYVLDMFPYPSGAGLHVGHPLGYIASDIFSRYKKLKGFNVLHPIGYDAYGLPAEQYAIETGQHPKVTTENNIARYEKQLKKIGLSFDWSRVVKTCEKDYYHWTQWTFIQLFKHYYDTATNRAEKIEKLVSFFEKRGSEGHTAYTDQSHRFTAKEWQAYSEEKQQGILLSFRLAYLSEGNVNWCPSLGTVLANDEVKEGLSVRGNHPVIQKRMKQWSLRISAYAQRLLDDLEELTWSSAIKEVQRHWIGRSEGATVRFPIEETFYHLDIYTTRPDTIFGATFMVLAPESDLVSDITSEAQAKEVQDYLDYVQTRSTLSRISEKKITGVFSGNYAINPFTKKKIPIWISEYVLADYGTGAIMAVPAHDSRDYAFAKYFDLSIVPVIEGADITDEAYEVKTGVLMNSDFLNKLNVPEAIEKAKQVIEQESLGERTINYRLRDAIFSRQRYWGEPIPIYYKNGLPYPIDEEKLPLELPQIDDYRPTTEGEPPLGRAKNWATTEGYPYELTTMPGFAGSSAYYLRYMSPHDSESLVTPKANAYWQDVDLYVGGIEHATGHLLYARFWNKFLFDIGVATTSEPFKRLINQGMIQGQSAFVYRKKETNTFVSYNLRHQHDTVPINVDINLVKKNVLDIEAFKQWRSEYNNATFILEEDVYICGESIEKMSKSKYNVVTPDEIIEQYGADTLRLYEMFLGPITDSKPWNTQGIEGVHKFLRKFWGLCFDENNQFKLTDDKATPEELKTLHFTIKKIQRDIETFSLNTSISQFMIAVNHLTSLRCHKKEIIEPLTITLSPFAPHICEEVWEYLGYNYSITQAKFPEFNETYLSEESYEYPVSINGKVRCKETFNLDTSTEDIEQRIRSHEVVLKWTEGKDIKKVIIVPKKIINIVV